MLSLDKRIVNGCNYYMSKKEARRTYSLNGKYKFLIRETEKGEKEVLYEAKKDSNFSFASIRNPIVIILIMLINYFAFELIRKLRRIM